MMSDVHQLPIITNLTPIPHTHTIMAHIRHNLPSGEKRTLAFGICDRIAQGELLTTITQDPGMPHPDTFRNWLKADPAIATRYAGAREDRIEKLMQDLLSLLMESPATYKDKHGNIRTDSAAVSHLRVRVNALRWLITLLTDKSSHTSSSAEPEELPPIPAPATDESASQHTHPSPTPEKSQPHPPSATKPPTTKPTPKSPGVVEIKTIDQVAAFVDGMLGFEHPPFPSLIEHATSPQPLAANLTVATLKLPPRYAENLTSPL